MAGLVTCFAEISLLPDLLALRYEDNIDQTIDQWTRLLTEIGCNTGHVEVADFASVEVEISNMAIDAWNLSKKIKLLDEYGQLTDAGQRLAAQSNIPPVQRHHGDHLTVQNILANQVAAHYRGDQELDIPKLLQQGKRSNQAVHAMTPMEKADRGLGRGQNVVVDLQTASSISVASVR